MCPDRLPAPLRGALSALFWLLVWQLASMAVGSQLLLPSPGAAAAALVRLAALPAFWRSAGASLLRILLGLLAGTAAALLLAAATCASPWARLLLAPLIRTVRAAPVASFILLVLLWVSRAAVPGVISALMVLPVVWESVTKAAEQTDPLLLELARAYRFGPWKTLRLVYVPSVLPHFAAGLNTAVGLAWKAGVAAEVICRPRLAAGTQIYNAKLALETPDLFAWTAVVIAMSLCLEQVMARLLRSLAHGKGAAA